MGDLEDKSEGVPIRVLASGGIDSTALIAFYLSHSAKINCIHFQYGQSNAESERKSFGQVCDYYKVTGTIVNLGFSMVQRKEEFLGRNALFALIAGCLEPPPARIALGIHKGSLEYYDCTKTFVEDCQRILDGYFSGTVTLETPFIDLTSVDIAKYTAIHNVPVNLTYSCGRQNHPPCGRCASCIARAMLY